MAMEPHDSLSYSSLKARQRQIREGFPENLGLRVHRALSWLCRAEQESADADARFLFLWISMNAAYANEVHDRRRFSEIRVLLNFLERLIAMDRDRLLYGIVWQEFTGPIRMLINNRYVYRPFWDHQNGKTAEPWETGFESSKARMHRALGQMDTKKVLAVVFDRLYVLRNQLMHGGATWNGSVNRSQVADGAAILGRLVPAVIHIMMESGEGYWGEPAYRVVPAV